MSIQRTVSSISDSVSSVKGFVIPTKIVYKVVVGLISIDWQLDDELINRIDWSCFQTNNE